MAHRQGGGRSPGRWAVTATDKVDKKPLWADRWRTTDPVWHRRVRTTTYERMTAGDVGALEGEFAEHQRANLLN